MPCFIFRHAIACMFISCCLIYTNAQSSYFFPKVDSWDEQIPSPAAFLGYDIGSHHTRHDRIVSYFETLARISPKASFQQLGETYEHRPLITLTISSPENMERLDVIQQQHLQRCTPSADRPSDEGLPVIINLGYNVHGNEPSSAEAAMLTAYYLLAAQDESVERFLSEAVIFIDPVINPDGRDRHSHWANMHKGDPLVTDPYDREHNEVWPGGRTNHYWFDLNRDWLLLVHPELQTKMKWYHQWYPNVVTDFHEMGTYSTYFFEPPKDIGTKVPLMPEANYTTLNNLFAEFYTKSLDEIGTLYFTREVYDGTYPGYGSSYPDLQGGLGLLFEQASSRGHAQESPLWIVTFPYTIRNQLRSSIATIEAAVTHKQTLFDYQRDFFESAITNANSAEIKAYVFGDPYDKNRTKAFIDMLLQHNIEIYELSEDISSGNIDFEVGNAYMIPVAQPQYRMVQTMFETYQEYSDSVFYDASAWSLVHAYGMPHAALSSNLTAKGDQLTSTEEFVPEFSIEKSNYAYVIDWRDYKAPGALAKLIQGGIKVLTSFKPFSVSGKEYGYGTLLVPLQIQSVSPDSIFSLMNEIATQDRVPCQSLTTGRSESGPDLGSRNFRVVSAPKALMIVGRGTSGYETGEVWHLLDQRVHMPITKVEWDVLSQVNMYDYHTMIWVSGSYDRLNEKLQEEIKRWINSGNTLITTRTATEWVVQQGWTEEKLIRYADSTEEIERLDYVLAPEISGAQEIGGSIFEIDLDVTHPIGFGFTNRKLPIYRNSEVILSPAENPFATVAQYTANPLISGYISQTNLDSLRNSAAIIVSQSGSGRIISFTDNPNFRGTWYGTNKLFLNALFFGDLIRVPSLKY